MATVTPPLRKRVKRYARFLLLRALLVPVHLALAYVLTVQRATR